MYCETQQQGNHGNRREASNDNAIPIHSTLGWEKVLAMTVAQTICNKFLSPFEWEAGIR